ncbi:MAG: FtsQ-type POTRA domain-containing protein [Anaerolineae bacterium]|nr:FtsQ-type POTRA domain-containing protein [Anaerolineae bacterium]
MAQQIHTPRRSTSAKHPAVRRQGRFPLPGIHRQFNWRFVSAGLAIGSIALGVFIFTNPIFFVTQVEVGGVRYVPADEIFTNSGVADYHILWVDPEEVQQSVTQSPSLSSAQVVLQWPARVIILVREREPALVWEQGGERYWVDVNGNLMRLRQDLPNLVRVINEGEAIPFSCPGPGCPEEDKVTVDPAVVLGAQQLKTLRSNIDMLYYDPVRGLSYQDGRGWRGYFGIGTNMDLKLVIYETLVDNLQQRGITPISIDVSNPDAPFYYISR